MANHEKESPEYVKMSHATAISLGLMNGRMYRGAVNKCVNLLVHHPEGCAANCAYCGLAKKRPGRYRDKSFIHVAWPISPMEQVVAAIRSCPSYVKRACISMITNGKSRQATLMMARTLTKKTSLPLSVLIAPTVMSRDDLVSLKDAGVDKIGIAIDLATPELFDKYRGSGVSGPHRWERYWEILEDGLRIFENPNVGVHLMVGMGETELEMVSIMDKLRGMGIANHLFSFFAEQGSLIEDRPQPPWPTYLRIQLARYLIEEGQSRFTDMYFDKPGRIVDFGLDSDRLTEIIDIGVPFMTTGCQGPDGDVACNRPFGNCLPDVQQWNYPYPPNREERALIRENIFNMQ
jgi:biotin synthase-related radical SAM superfamily protein